MEKKAKGKNKYDECFKNEKEFGKNDSLADFWSQIYDLQLILILWIIEYV